MNNEIELTESMTVGEFLASKPELLFHGQHDEELQDFLPVELLSLVVDLYCIDECAERRRAADHFWRGYEAGLAGAPMPHPGPTNDRWGWSYGIVERENKQPSIVGEKS